MTVLPASVMSAPFSAASINRRSNGSSATPLRSRRRWSACGHNGAVARNPYEPREVQPASPSGAASRHSRALRPRRRPPIAPVTPPPRGRSWWPRRSALPLTSAARRCRDERYHALGIVTSSSAPPDRLPGHDGEAGPRGVRSTAQRRAEPSPPARAEYEPSRNSQSFLGKGVRPSRRRGSALLRCFGSWTPWSPTPIG